MRYNFTGKNMAINDAMREKIASKIDRLERLFPENTEVFVVMKALKQYVYIEVSIPLSKRTLRAEVSAEQWLDGVDAVVNAVERQVVKYKSRLKGKSRRDHSFKEELNYFAATHVEPDEPETEEEASAIVIEKTKKFAFKPMDAEEAVMEMEMLDHSFFVFRNAKTDEINVVYKRKDGKYGLIEPNA